MLSVNKPDLHSLNIHNMYKIIDTVMKINIISLM